MKISILLGVVLLGLTSAVPVEESLYQDIKPTDDASNIENAIREMLDQIRELFLNGNEELPVLDPLQIYLLELGEYGANISMSNFAMKNLATFDISRLEVSRVSIIPTVFAVKLDGYIPNLDIQIGHYDMYITVPGTNARIFGEGSASLSIVAPQIEGEIRIRTSLLPIPTVQLTSSDLRFHLQKFQSNIQGFMNDDGISNFINAFLGYLIPDLIEFFKEDISNVINTVVMDVGNQMLSENIHLFLDHFPEGNR